MSFFFYRVVGRLQDWAQLLAGVKQFIALRQL
jgi:hypothetical protein